jgi:D-beta-D-heptose 7-phosphate kinase / D-beta-D-heptose 1-phosphate adenosyltransferase
MNLSELTQKRILVVGDVMLDRYLWGDARRISPEAPVPVVRVRQQSEVPGGAGNVAANLAGLECPVSILGICGNDESGNRLRKIFLEKGIEPLLQESIARPTITKTRVMARGQQLLRLDEEEPRILSPELEAKIIARFEQEAPACDVVVLSDYGKGIFQTPNLCQHLIGFCRSCGIPVLVDPKGTDWTRYQGATCITPNTAELERVTDSAAEESELELIQSASAIRSQYGLEWLLVTRGSRGMILCGNDVSPLMIPARAREVFDVSGAGDTVIASLAAGLALGLSFARAAQLSNLAAGIVVGKLGTQPITRPELSSAIELNDMQRQSAGASKIAALESARILVKSWQSSGQKVVFTNGCYDLLHPGHIHLLHLSRDLGDRLIVGLNTDASVRRLKGNSRPIVAERDRAAIVSALGCVDLVVLFDEDTPLHLIEAIKPDILVKGEDYRLDQVVGREAVESYGGRVCLVPLLQGYSTTQIAEKIASTQQNLHE